MKEISLDVIKDASHRLLFDLSEEEYATLLEELRILSKQMEAIGKDEGLENYEPMAFPFPCETTYLREDEPTTPLDRDEALSNTGSRYENQIKLPKVVG